MTTMQQHCLGYQVSFHWMTNVISKYMQVSQDFLQFENDRRLSGFADEADHIQTVDSITYLSIQFCLLFLQLALYV